MTPKSQVLYCKEPVMLMYNLISLGDTDKNAISTVESPKGDACE